MIFGSRYSEFKPIYLIVGPVKDEHRNGKESRFEIRPDLNLVRNVDVKELSRLGWSLEQFSCRDVAFLFVASRKIEGRVEGLVRSVAELEQGPTCCWI